MSYSVGKYTNACFQVAKWMKLFNETICLFLQFTSVFYQYYSWCPGVVPTIHVFLEWRNSESCYFWRLFLWYMCLNTLVSKLWVAQWEGWLLPGERETLRVVVRCWEAPRLLRRSTGPTSHDTPCVPCRFPSGQCRVCALPICICKSMTSKGNKWSIFARQVSPLFILCCRFCSFHCMKNIGKQTLSWHPAMCCLQLSFWPMQPFFFLRN